MVKVKVKGMALDVESRSPVLILAQDNQDTPLLPIWIGQYEAWAIAIELSGARSQRPLTHELLHQMILRLGGMITRVEITELKEHTYFAKIHIATGGETVLIDARPSDAVALALKAKVEIFANPELFQEITPDDPKPHQIDGETLKNLLKGMRPEDFGQVPG